MKNGSYKDPHEIDPLWTDRRVSDCGVLAGWTMSGFFIFGMVAVNTLLS
jgi:hypothetical protein